MKKKISEMRKTKEKNLEARREKGKKRLEKKAKAWYATEKLGVVKTDKAINEAWNNSSGPGFIKMAKKQMRT